MTDIWVDLLDRASHTGTQPLTSIDGSETIVQLEDVNGVPGLPAVDGSQLTGIAGATGTPTVFVQAADPGSEAVAGDTWIQL